MLDLACIFTTGGVILFWKTFCDLGIEFVNEFIFNVLVQERLNDKQWKMKDRIFIWKYEPEIKLVFLFAYQELFKSLDFQEMLSYTKSFYKKTVWPEVGKNGDLIMYIPPFDKEFDRIFRAYTKKTQAKGAENRPDMKVDSAAKLHEPDNEEPASEEAADMSGEEEETSEPQNGEDLESSRKDSGPNSILKSNRDAVSDTEKKQVRSVGFKEEEGNADRSGEGTSNVEEKKLTAREKMELNIKKKRDEKQKKKDGAGESVKDTGKTDRTWGHSQKIDSKSMAALDYSKKFSQSSGNVAVESQKNNSYFEKDEELDLDYDIISDEEKKTADKKTKTSGILSSFKNTFKSFTEGKNLSEADLRKVLDKFKDDLMAKNVAEEIARGIVESLKVKLLNQKVQVFSSVSELVKSTLKETLTKILTPKKNHDILTEASKARERGEPYVIAFIGVNGVGKSTNLAKVAYLFKSNHFSVMFAACDNFRAGAVEQLKTHGRNLDIPVYDRGYKDEPHRIAREAIREAKSKRIDVVLIDTAGRMQNNEPLMKALAKLVSVNNPDMVVFIGEALVGNDGVDQLTSFNSALIKYSTEERERREIDAILISKFDTVDEKSRFLE